MRNIVIGALAAIAIGLAGPAGQAAAAPNGPSNAQQTIKELQSQGYTVIVNRLGSSPLDRASVVAVRPGPNFSRTDTLSAVTQRTVYVDVK
ncbi:MULTISPECIES: hypothetical protein [Mycolicibacterium]|uniref:PASTA domain-containing protein n=3 Tax=Mycolicibacterium fortuitum TaxID=1766 RepID=A0A1A0RIT8_MYCFO|nr:MULTISPECIES: hypothetical protein [Mycolicibacterium]AIY48893.1 hypothetical protein G155_29060 [Mycobacterium sp. VKM Ac-1817D]CRL70476.1 hypothetical protein CPGR_00475 [Mycolicibacter nonchromogenicus]AMD56154.1 hypothetical protein ATO49_27765 [Mycolicibacterium fortuitum subsp. fortuitum DSM 46621 = ATCC 6841 = JCM 6387]EJZ07184.1 hypothetical protein MFORT_26584 [Mycolicibacterium fortuitum subsp. fortuitum DSM 46621 = ATCC 6841 = JCM 6387]MCA4721456.1 hypothetical protein [Mycolicib